MNLDGLIGRKVTWRFHAIEIVGRIEGGYFDPGTASAHVLVLFPGDDRIYPVRLEDVRLWSDEPVEADTEAARDKRSIT